MNHSIRNERDNTTTDTKAIRKGDQCILQITLCPRTLTTFKKIKRITFLKSINKVSRRNYVYSKKNRI